MTLEQWRTRMGWTRQYAHQTLGLSDNTYRRYERGESPVPPYIWLACAALMYDIPPINFSKNSFKSIG